MAIRHAYHARSQVSRLVRASSDQNQHALMVSASTCFAPRRNFFNWGGSAVHIPLVASGEGSRNVEFMNSIPAQDPRGRIRMIHPAIDLDTIEMMDRKHRHGQTGQDPGPFEIHCLPFWTMMHFSEVHTSRLYRATGKTVRDVNMKPDYGFSVAAVGEDHWAHGTILTEGARHVWQSVIAHAQTRPELSNDHWNYPLNELHFPSTNYTPFAYGYPVMTREEIFEIWMRQQTALLENAMLDSAISGMKSTLTMIVDIPKPTDIIAIPTYRIVVRARYKDYAYLWDASYTRDHGVTMEDYRGHIPLEHSSGRKIPFHIIPDQVDEAERHYMGFQYFEIARTFKVVGWEQGPEAEKPEEYRLNWSNIEGDLFIADTIMNALRRAGPPNWEDPNILPADPTMGNTIMGLVNFATKRLLRTPTGPLPQAFSTKPAPGSARSKSRMILQTRPPPKPPAPRTKDPPLGKAPSNDKPSVAGPRYTMRPPSAPVSPAKLTPQIPLPPPSPTVQKSIGDTRDLYKALGIQPTTVYIRPDQKVAAEKLLNNAKKAVWGMWHPDSHLRFGEAGQKAAQKKFQDATEAYESLKTLEQRQQYEAER